MPPSRRSPDAYGEGDDPIEQYGFSDAPEPTVRHSLEDYKDESKTLAIAAVAGMLATAIVYGGGRAAYNYWKAKGEK